MKIPKSSSKILVIEQPYPYNPTRYTAVYINIKSSKEYILKIERIFSFKAWLIFDFFSFLLNKEMHLEPNDSIGFYFLRYIHPKKSND